MNSHFLSEKPTPPSGEVIPSELGAPPSRTPSDPLCASIQAGSDTPKGKLPEQGPASVLEEWTLDLQPVRDVLARLVEIWGEVERFVLALLDGWSVVLHQLAAQTEQRISSADWFDQVFRCLRRLDQRFAQLAEGLDQLQMELRSRESLEGTSLQACGDKPSEAELAPFIVPIRPESRTGSQPPETNPLSARSILSGQPKGTTSPDKQDDPRSAVPSSEKGVSTAASSPEKLEALLRSWASLAEQLDQLLPRTPEEV